MLKSLCIQNVATAQNVFIPFGVGLNVITGPTGAGKSLIINALALLAGRSTSLTPHRNGPSFVEAIFEQDTKSSSKLPSFLKVRRDFFNRSSKCSINEKTVSQKTLFSLCQELIDFTSQFEHQLLFKPSYQREAFDFYAKTNEVSASYQRLWQSVQCLLKDRSQLLKDWYLWEEDRPQIETTLDFIESLNPDPEEYSQLSFQFKEFQKSQKFLTQIENVNKNCTVLEESLEALKRSLNGLTKALSDDPDFLNTAHHHLENLFCTHYQLQSFLEDKQHFYQLAPEDFQNFKGRWEEYHRLLRAYGPTVEDALRSLGECREKMKSGERLWNSIKTSEDHLTDSLKELCSLAQKLSALRRKKVKELQCEIQSTLKSLGMPHAVFEIKMIQAQSSLLLDGALMSSLPMDSKNICQHLGPFGLETPQFWFSANPDLPPLPLEHIASGGELSRILLALKALNLDNSTAQVFIFDEIDSGISGSVASQVGKKLSEFCKNHQAICITHLPQVACHAHTHFVVSKELDGGVSHTTVSQASGHHHIEAVAKLLSGSYLSPQSLAQAHFLVNEAKHA